MEMPRTTLMLVLGCLWCSQSIASDFDGFTSEENSYGYSSYWNWKPTTEGGWEYIAAWMNQDGDVVWEAKFDTEGAMNSDDPLPHVPFHD